MTRKFEAQPFFDPAAESLRYLPEGPRILRNFPSPDAKLGWVAIQHGAGVPDGSLNVLDLATLLNTSFPLPGRPGFFAETTRPGLVLVGLERSLVYFDLLAGQLRDTLVEVTNDVRVIVNDGLAVEGGALFGTKHLEFNQPLAALYFFDTLSQRLHTVLDAQYCSNGKFLRRTEAGAILIDIDTIPKKISRYVFDSTLQQLAESSLVTPPECLPSLPDGLRPAPDGESVIVSFYNPAEVADGVAQELRLRDGAVLSEWRIPGSPRVTCPEFVQIEGQVKLLFATAVEDMPPATRRLAPGAGHFYLADTPFTTMPAPPPLVWLES